MQYFANLRIKRFIIHEIYKRDEQGMLVLPKYNELLTKLEPIGLQTLQNRIVNALGDSSHSIQMEAKKTDADSVFQYGAELFNLKDEDFIDFSKKITYALADNQKTKTIPGGVVLIFSGLTGITNNRFWGIIKAEVHEGFSKESTTENLIIKYVNDLLLTPQQRLYKLGVFIEIGTTETENKLRVADDFNIFVFDHNMAKNETQHAAFYFFRDFLGCDYS